jgi:hypothetical protein
MLIRRIALVLTLALGGTHAANAEPATGMELQQWCSNPKGSTESFECAVYMRGFLDGYVFLRDTAQKAFCLPSDVTVGQARLITNKFMSEHPDELHKSAPAIIVRALHIAFACKRSDEAGRW